MGGEAARRLRRAEPANQDAEWANPNTEPANQDAEWAVVPQCSEAHQQYPRNILNRDLRVA